MILTCPHNEIIRQYIEKLLPYKVYSKIALQSIQKPYIIITSTDESDDSNKDYEGYIVNVELRICTEYNGDEMVNDIAKDVQQKLFTSKRKSSIELTEFDVMDSVVTRNSSLGLIKSPTQTINDNILIIQHKISQK